MRNRFQEVMVKAYGGGDFADITKDDEAKQVYDGLFLFLFRELSDKEDCDSKHEALRRLDTALRDIETVIVAIENSPDDMENAA